MIIFCVLILCLVLMVWKLLANIGILTNKPAPETWQGPEPDLGDAVRYNDRLLKLGVITEREHRANLDRLAEKVKIDFADLLPK
ncbi:MAG: hypothetical protein MUE71_09165 [Chitinophagaceae bacterium]|jgi:hypothetical protein|nr:hypothetical protein [Chitinophagaceae bacterium]